MEVVVDIGGETRTFEIVAGKAGRRVDISTVRGTVEVSEVTRTGEVVRTGRFMASRVVAVMEFPHSDDTSSGRLAQTPSNQTSML